MKNKFSYSIYFNNDGKSFEELMSNVLTNYIDNLISSNTLINGFNEV